MRLEFGAFDGFDEVGASVAYFGDLGAEGAHAFAALGFGQAGGAGDEPAEQVVAAVGRPLRDVRPAVVEPVRDRFRAFAAAGVEVEDGGDQGAWLRSLTTRKSPSRSSRICARPRTERASRWIG
ncbi:MAG: hypothetical protein H0V19_06160 [Euzebyales bacterium]|nr:hypothetical protein [Euzebyales bacterium]